MALEEKTARGGRERWAGMVLKFKGFGVSSLSAERERRSIRSPSCSYNFNTEKKERREDICGRSRRRNVGCVGTRNELNSFLR